MTAKKFGMKGVDDLCEVGRWDREADLRSFILSLSRMPWRTVDFVEPWSEGDERRKRNQITSQQFTDRRVCSRTSHGLWHSSYSSPSLSRGLRSGRSSLTLETGSTRSSRPSLHYRTWIHCVCRTRDLAGLCWGKMNLGYPVQLVQRDSSWEECCCWVGYPCWPFCLSL